jgi:hypothetical protein
MEDAVMRPAEAVICQYPVGVSDEIAIGEEKQLYQVVRNGLGRGLEGGVVRARFGQGQKHASKNLGQPY